MAWILPLFFICRTYGRNCLMIFHFTLSRIKKIRSNFSNLAQRYRICPEHLIQARLLKHGKRLTTTFLVTQNTAIKAEINNGILKRLEIYGLQDTMPAITMHTSV